MSIMEIIDQLPKLKAEERHQLWERLEELEWGHGEETPQMLADIDAGRRSMREGQGHTIAEAHDRVRQWTSKSA